MSNYYQETYAGWYPDAVPRQQKKWLNFLSLRFGAIISTIAPIICFAWAYTQHQDGAVSTDGLGASWASINLGTAAYGFTWSTALFLVVLIFNCAVPPGFIIFFDCIAWLAQLITIIFYMQELGGWHAGGYGYSKNRTHEELYGAEVFGASMMLLGMVFNIVLMIVASRACHVQRKAKKQTAYPKIEDA
ncbi:hypothetical protein PENSTE_c007G09907 [Penicillium steckii]|uniref:MARVEL domain-containing protein n=1 Tax=Penicillium steckii TaxID=303698 RepID=A0A1V6TEI5_9EURO|nr:hypothetical protein PENSTE_c007G09907 [Penicillium steckii]